MQSRIRPALDHVVPCSKPAAALLLHGEWWLIVTLFAVISSVSVKVCALNLDPECRMYYTQRKANCPLVNYYGGWGVSDRKDYNW